MWKPNPECNIKFVEIKNKPATIMGPICGYCKECYKNPTNTMDRYAGIWTNEECQQLFVTHMRVLQEMPKKQAAIMGLICGYCIFENLLMKFIIENDVGIICLKCVYCFKTLKVMWVLLCKYCTMFILIFGLILTSQVLKKLWQRRHMLNHTHSIS
jgi:hypothetical protein